MVRNMTGQKLISGPATGAVAIPRTDPKPKKRPIRCPAEGCGRIVALVEPGSMIQSGYCADHQPARAEPG